MGRLVSTTAQARATPRTRRARQPFWLWEFLRVELAPYPGRASAVARMVAASTLAMLIIMTFHLPNGALGGYFALVISRESLNKTIASSFYTLCMVLLATVYIVASMAALLGSPVTHFLWVIGTLYLLFYVMSAGRNYAMASSFFFPVVSAIPLWDGVAPVDVKLSLTLYTLLSVAIAALATLLVETVYRSFSKEDPVIERIADQLFVCEATVRALSTRKRPSPRVEKYLLQYAMTGPSGLRRQLIRGGVTGEARARSAALVSFTNRLLELIATGLHRVESVPVPTDAERARFIAVADALHAQHRALQPLRDIAQITTLSLPQFESDEEKATRLPLLPEIERTTALISQSMGSLGSSQNALSLPETGTPQRGSRTKWSTSFSLRNLFKPDAFSNRDHLVFFPARLRRGIALLHHLQRRRLAGHQHRPGHVRHHRLSRCWILAAETDPAHRRRARRWFCHLAAGADLPVCRTWTRSLRSPLFFAAVTAMAAWLATSSPRFSYFGMQIALAFFLINLNETYIQISLSVARDRVVGVLLGLTAMWLVFDQIAAPVAVVQMRTLLRSNLEFMGDIACLLPKVRLNLQEEPSPELIRFRELRERINDLFSQMNAQADAILFEFGTRRRKHLQDRDRMLTMQPAMRSFFLHTMTLLDGSNRWELAPEGRLALAAFLNDCGDTLHSIAALFGQERERTAKQPNEVSPQDRSSRFSSVDDGLAATEQAQSRLRQTSGIHGAAASLAISMLHALQAVAKHASAPRAL